jgi:hypothetical protein
MLGRAAVRVRDFPLGNPEIKEHLHKENPAGLAGFSVEAFFPHACSLVRFMIPGLLVSLTLFISSDVCETAIGNWPVFDAQVVQDDFDAV